MASKLCNFLPPVRPVVPPQDQQILRGPRFVVCGLWFLVWGLGFGVWDLGFGVWGSVFGVWGLGFGFWGLRFEVWDLPRRTDREFKNQHVNLERSKIIARFPLSDYEKVGNNVSFVPMPGTHSCL